MRIVVVSLFVIMFGVQVLGLVVFSNLKASSSGISMRGASVVMFVADHYDEDDLQGIKEYLDNWRSKVTIAGTAENVTSTGSTSMTTDMLLAGIDDITVFDAVFIPGGEHAQALIANQQVIQLLETADNEGIVIAGLDEGTLVQAAAGLIDGKEFTTDPGIVVNLTAAGGIQVEKNVVTDGNIITATAQNYQELSYAIANTLGYSYDLAVDLSFEKEAQGWNYTVTISVSDEIIIESMYLNLSLKDSEGGTALVATIELSNGNSAGKFSGNLGILANGNYNVDVKSVSIYGHIEIRENIKEFSVDSN